MSAEGHFAGCLRGVFEFLGLFQGIRSTSDKPRALKSALICLLAASVSPSIVGEAHDRQPRELFAGNRRSMRCNRIASSDIVSQPEQLKRDLLFNVNIPYDVDPRVDVKTFGQPHLFSMIGIVRPTLPITMIENRSLDNPRGTAITHEYTRGTGFLISPCIVATNAHVVYGDIDPGNGFINKQTATFFVGHDPTTGQNLHIHAIPLSHGKAWFREYFPSDAHDIEFLQLDSCRGADPQIGYMEIDDQNIANDPNYGIMTAGFPYDKSPSTIWVDPLCHTHGDGPGFSIYHDCVTVHGDSGEPGFYNKNGVPYAVFVNQLDGGRDSSDLNVPGQPAIIGRWHENTSNEGIDLVMAIKYTRIPAIVIGNRTFRDITVAEALMLDKYSWGNRNPIFDAVKTSDR